MIEATTSRKDDAAPAMAARSGFKGYSPGSRRRTGKAEVKEDRVLEQLKTLWREWKHMEKLNKYYGFDDYFAMLEHIRSSGLDYSAEDVEKFSLVLGALQDEMDSSPGLFLTALINNGEDEKYVIHTSHFRRGLSIGFMNTKTIHVDGDILEVGRCMRSGRIHVKGHAGWVGVEMTGGEIHVDEGFSCRGEGPSIKIYSKGKLVYPKSR